MTRPNKLQRDPDCTDPFRYTCPPASIEKYVKENYQPISPLRGLRDAAIEAGRLASWDWMLKNSPRRHYVRPALQQEYAWNYASSFPPAIVCVSLMWMDDPCIGQYVVGVSECVVDFARTDRGEEYARSMWEMAQDNSAVQRNELVQLHDEKVTLLGCRLNDVPRPDGRTIRRFRDRGLL